MSDQPFQLFRGAVASNGGDTDWGRLVWLADGATAGVEATVGFVEILPRTANPTHRHPDCHEVLVVLEGTLEHRVGDGTVDLHPGDVLVVPPGMIHGARNPGEVTARMLVVYDRGRRGYEPVE